MKESVPNLETLIGIIKWSAQGSVILNPHVVPQTAPSRNLRLTHLTPRQLDVLDLIAQGYSNTAIADRLEVSTRTVESYITAIYQHLGVSTDQRVHPRVKVAILYLQELVLPEHNPS
jgi:DNA-binding NarL/FixJ family response regulator